MRKLVAIIVLLIFVGVVAALYFSKVIPAHEKTGAVFQQAVVTSTAAEKATSTRLSASTSTSSAPSVQYHPGMKLYRNDEYGFEFWYPEKWELFIHQHGLGYYSKFTIILYPATSSTATYVDTPMLVNVVLPIFADNTFRGAQASTSSITVANVSGIEYTYPFEGNESKSVVFSLEKNKIIIGTDSVSDYGDILSQILSTFKFLK